MKEDQIIKQLNSLKELGPSDEYSAVSKLKLIHQAPQKPGRYFVFSQSLSSSLSMGLVIIFFAVIALGGVSNFVNNPFSPTLRGVNEELAAEAGEVNDAILIHIDEVKYLNNLATGTLAQVSFENERSGSSIDEEIDALLSEAISL